MGLTGSLQVGRSGLLTSQAALQVTGHNLSNLATPGYHRQTATITPGGSTRLHDNAYLGRGVQLESITRQVDEALESRLRSAIGDEAFSLTRHDLLAQVEALQNELSGSDLSTKLGTFFNAWSQLANNPQDASLRQLVIEEGATLSDFIQQMRGDLAGMRAQIDGQAGDAAQQVNNLLSKIEQLNRRIGTSSGNASSGAAGLKDQRDALLAELGEYLDISTVSGENGVTDVYVGSLPIILNGRSRGVELRSETVDGELQIDLLVGADKSPLDLTSGKLGALVQFRKEDLEGVVDTLDTFASQLIWQVNRVHSQGQGTQGFATVTGATQALDPAVALNDEASGLDFLPEHGSFQVHVRQKSTGQTVTSTINIDLDGINAATDTTLASLTSDLDAIANLGASITPDGRLHLAADSTDFEITFSNDSSGALAALGINTFFTGKNAYDIGLNATVQSNPQLLAIAQDNVAGDNRNALAMVGLRDQAVKELGGQSLTGYWSTHVERLAIDVSQARQANEADAIVRENLAERQQQVSGVNADEEAINLLQYQRAYQASARFISTVDELMQTLINMV